MGLRRLSTVAVAHFQCLACAWGVEGFRAVGVIGEGKQFCYLIDVLDCRMWVGAQKEQ